MIDTVVCSAGWSQQLPASQHQTRNWVMSRCHCPGGRPSIPHHNPTHRTWEHLHLHLHCGVSKVRGGMNQAPARGVYQLTCLHSLYPLHPDVPPSLGLWELGGDTLHPALACCLVPGLGWNHKFLQPRLCEEAVESLMVHGAALQCPAADAEHRGTLCRRQQMLSTVVLCADSSRCWAP